jgi:hypothetical protein
VGRLALLVMATVLGWGIASPATEASTTSFRLDLSMTPKWAGTSSKPVGIQLEGDMSFRPPADLKDLPVVTGGKLVLPRNIALNGDRYPTCRRRMMIRSQGVDRCPDRSIVGATSGFVHALPAFGYRPRITFVNGGKRSLWAFTTYYNPALVRAPIRVDVGRADGRGSGHELSFEVPAGLQTIVGIPMTVPDRLWFRIGGKPYARSYLVSEGCPKRGFTTYGLELRLLTSDAVTTTASYRGRLRCSRR